MRRLSPNKNRLGVMLLACLTSLQSLASAQTETSDSQPVLDPATSTKPGDPAGAVPQQPGDKAPANESGSNGEAFEEQVLEEEVEPAASSTDPQQPSSPPPASALDPYAEAKERVGRAEKLFEDGNYDAALTEFQRAYDTMAGHPARTYVLFNVGKCQEKLYRYDAAITSYKLYLASASDDEKDRSTVEAKIESLEGFLGTLVLEISVSDGSLPGEVQVWVDGRLIADNNRRFLIPGGNHQVKVMADGLEEANQEVQLPARSEKKLVFVLTPLAKEYKGLSSSYFYTAGGLALAAGVAGGAIGFSALSKRSQINNMASEAVSEDDVDSLKSRAMVADIFFVGAGVFATTAVILGFMTNWSDNRLPSEERAENKTLMKIRGVQVREIDFGTMNQGGFVNVRGAF